LIVIMMYLTIPELHMLADVLSHHHEPNEALRGSVHSHPSNTNRVCSYGKRIKTFEYTEASSNV